MAQILLAKQPDARINRRGKLGQRCDEAGRVENGRDNNTAEGRAEPIFLSQNEIGEKEQATKDCEERRMKEHGGLRERHVTIDGAEQDCAETVARVEADPELPHSGLPGEYWRHLLHSRFERRVSGPELRAEEREDEVGDAEGQGD